MSKSIRFLLRGVQGRHRDAMHWSLVVRGFLLMVLVGAIAVPAAFAGSSVGNFEIDGNKADDSGPGDPIDWATPPPNLTTFTDTSGQGDDIFGQGSKELEPGGWQCVTGSAPSKDDIVNGNISIRTIGKKRFMFVNYQRAGVQGDAHIDWELSQSNETGPSCPALPKRTDGDVAVTFDTELGGKKIIVRAFKWAGDSISGTFNELPLGSQGGIWDGAVNIPPSLTIPGVENGAFGEAALNITDSPLNALCPAAVYMKTRASTSITSALKDRTAPQPIGFKDRPDLAKAHDSAFGARVQMLGINTTLPVDDDNHRGTPAVDSSQSGVGSDSDDEQVLEVKIPASGDILSAGVLRASSTSPITDAPAQAKHTSVAEAVNVNVLNGLVKADLVRGVATTTASGTTSSFSSIGSTFENLVVNGVAQDDVTPDTRIDLPAALFGAGSFVMLYERVGSTSTPAPGQISGGTFAADLTVNMIRVHVTGIALVPAVDVIVSNAVAHSDFPQRELCDVPPEQTVSGHAFIASATTDPSLLPTTLGFVSIPPTGGLDHQDLNEATIPADDGSTLSAGVSVSESSGGLTATESEASSFAGVTDVCVLSSGVTCTVGAQLLRAQSNSLANAGGASSNDTGTQLLNVTVAGITQSDNAPPNTVIPLDGLGFVTLNEQYCDGQPVPTTPGPVSCTGATSSGRTVRAIHLVVTVPDNPLGLKAGAEIIVSEAHSDATFVPSP